MPEQNTDVKSLAHTKWNCKYHVVFAPKYRRKVFFNEKRADIREILRTLCQWKGVEIIEGEVCPDHIHLLLSIPPKYSVSGFMGYLKGKKQSDDIPKVWEHEVCIPKPRILVSRILRRYSREKYCGNKAVYSESAESGQRKRSVEPV